MNYASHSYAASLNFFCELGADTMKVVVKYRPWRRQNLSPWRLCWRKIHSCRDHGEGSSIVVDTENFNCSWPSPRGNELSQILKMVSQTLIFFDRSQKNWRNSWSVFKISYTWNATVSVELPLYKWQITKIVENDLQYLRMVYVTCLIRSQE